MGDYYNTTRGPLSVTLNDGSAMSVSPKKWIYVTPANEGSDSLQRAVSKGFLKRALVPITQPPAPVVVPAVEPVVVAEPAAVVAAAPAEKAEAVSAASSKGDRFGKQR